jgi:hypothetical protein
MIVERFAVQQQARRRVGVSILHRCPCGGIVCCNGLLAGAPMFPVAQRKPDPTFTTLKLLQNSPTLLTLAKPKTIPTTTITIPGGQYDNLNYASRGVVTLVWGLNRHDRTSRVSTNGFDDIRDLLLSQSQPYDGEAAQAPAAPLRRQRWRGTHHAEQKRKPVSDWSNHDLQTTWMR